jgi:hypothetical protein
VRNELGVVNCIVRGEWEELSANGANRLGKLRVIDVPGALRIERQRASFLDTSHPDLFEQYVAHSVWFRQLDGIRFEDPGADHPVSAERIYPANDPIIGALRRTTPTAVDPLTIGPAGDAREPLGSDAGAGRLASSSTCITSIRCGSSVTSTHAFSNYVISSGCPIGPSIA